MKFTSFSRLSAILETVDNSTVYDFESVLRLLTELTDRTIGIGIPCCHDAALISVFTKSDAFRKHVNEIVDGVQVNGFVLKSKVVSVRPPQKSKDGNPDFLHFHLFFSGEPSEGDQFDELVAATRLVVERTMLCNRNSIRNRILRARLSTNDLRSFVYKTMETTRKDIIPCEALSIFVHDKRIDQLRLRQTTGLASASRGTDLIIKRRGHSWVAKSYYSRKALFEWAEADQLVMGKTAESIRGIPKSRAYLPFKPEPEAVTPSKDKNGSSECSGLMRLLNCLDQTGRARPFDEFDRVNLQYLGELVHVNITGYVEKEVDGFDKDLAFHAAASVADGIVKNVDMAQRLLFGDSIERDSGVYGIPRQFEIRKIGSFPESQIQTLLNNAYAFATDIQSQIERSNVSPKTEDVQLDVVEKLLADVIMKAVNLKDSMRTAHSIDEKVVINRIFDLPRPPPVVGNQGELVSVFKNIIDNSIKYKRPHRNAEIHFSLSVDPAFVTVEVSDNGIGVNEDELELLFRPTYRTESAKSHRVRGSGLGLSYCRTIIESIGGEIWIERRDVGLSVFVKLRQAGK